ncbi:MAG: nucleotidyltransferase domain-containing protein [Planctomycetes bacterium]|nr:nucleotidyltransferase domain-containing protein [Planctomycetota bacterium]
MGTDNDFDRLGTALFSRNRRAIFGLLFGHADEAFYLRQIVRATGGGVGAIQRELRQLTAAGILRRDVRGKQVYFQADPDCPIFGELKSLVAKTTGMAGVLRAALAPLADRVGVAWVYGSVARGEETRSSDLDVLVVGDVSFPEIVAALTPAQQELRREVNPTLFPAGEFRSKIAAGQPFLTRVLQQPKVFLIGDEHDLERLAQQSLADGT